MLAAPPCPHEAYLVRELDPVERVQEHVLRGIGIRRPLPKRQVAECPALWGQRAVERRMVAFEELGRLSHECAFGHQSFA